MARRFGVRDVNRNVREVGFNGPIRRPPVAANGLKIGDVVAAKPEGERRRYSQQRPAKGSRQVVDKEGFRMLGYETCQDCAQRDLRYCDHGPRREDFSAASADVPSTCRDYGVFSS